MTHSMAGGGVRESYHSFLACIKHEKEGDHNKHSRGNGKINSKLWGEEEEEKKNLQRVNEPKKKGQQTEDREKSINESKNSITVKESWFFSICVWTLFLKH